MPRTAQSKGGQARAEKLTAKRRSEIASGAAKKRWGKTEAYRKEIGLAKPKKPRRKAVEPTPIPVPIVERPAMFTVEANLAFKLYRMADNRGVDVGTLVNVALHNLVLRDGILDLDSKLTFGKYAGLAVETVIRCDPRYVRWLVGNTDRVNLSDECLELLTEIEARCVSEPN